MAKTKIEWATHSWSPITGCTKVSPGCTHCYAERMARRLAGRFGYPEAPHHFDVTLRPERLEQPLGWRKPRRVFICSMSDLFHEDVPDNFIARVLTVMGNADQHTYQILTKRPDRMKELFSRTTWRDEYSGLYQTERKNWWFGVSVENPDYLWRIEELLKVPAVVRFVSAEPLLAELDLSPYLHCGISWCIIGAESGPNARPMDENWVRRLIAQCRQYEIPVFYKQKIVGGKKVSIPMLDGIQYAEFPPIIHKLNVK